MAENTSQSGSGGGTGGTGGKSAAPEEPRYSREELPDFLGVAPYIVSGALAEDERQTFTVKQGQAAVDKFFKHEDTSEGAQPDPEPEEG